jgi:hypothetical protein
MPRVSASGQRAICTRRPVVSTRTHRIFAVLDDPVPGHRGNEAGNRGNDQHHAERCEVLRALGQLPEHVLERRVELEAEEDLRRQGEDSGLTQGGLHPFP